MLPRCYRYAWEKHNGAPMIANRKTIKPSLIFDVTAMSLRLIPRNKVRIYKNGSDLYVLFCSLYKDSHPNVEYLDFIEVVKEIFPVYKNPRKSTDEFKISTYGLDENLALLGMENFPTKTFVTSEVLKIEM